MDLGKLQEALSCYEKIMKKLVFQVFHAAIMGSALRKLNLLDQFTVKIITKNADFHVLLTDDYLVSNCILFLIF